MVLFVILGVVVFLTAVIVGVLFYLLNKEVRHEEAVPVINKDIEQLQKNLSSKMFAQDERKIIDKDADIVPVFTSQPTFQVQQEPAPPEDDKYKIRAKELEEELRAISYKADGQSEEARRMIENLTRENESLKNHQAKLEDAQQRLAALQDEASGIKAENAGLQSQLELTNAKVCVLEGEMASVRSQMGEELIRANSELAELRQQKEELLSAPKPVPDEVLRQEVEALRSEVSLLKQKNEDLEKANQELQYGLIKARAQSSGLERVSFNYKNQLEDFFKRINAVQMSNEQLAQVKNRLEGMVEEAKLQNEELLKKDQLSQFELETNRSRLQSLERQYEELKAKFTA